MDSAVSEASTMLYLTDTPSPFLEGMAAQQQHTSRRRGPVKRQSSCLSGTELMAQTSDYLAQQQLSWVQLWPNQSQHAQLSWPAADAAYGMPAQQMPLAAPMLQQPQLQESASGNMLNSYGLEGHMGPMQAAVLGHIDAAAGTMPAPALVLDAASVAAAYDPAAATVPAAANMRAPQHRLPKRRASAPHLAAAAAAANQPMFKCVPHTSGADCQCTQCLCARTDELCKRLIAQRAAQITAPHDSAAAAAAAAAMQPASQCQPQQQQVRTRGQSPVHGKRRSLELPPNGKIRRSPDSNRQSPAGSPGQAAGYFPQQQQQQQQQQHPACMPYAAAQASAQAMMPSAGSGPLNGHFQQLSVSAFQGMPAAYAAASAAAAQQQMYAGAGQVHHSRHGSAHSEEAAIDQELEQLLAGVAWPELEVPVRQPPQPQRKQQPRQQPMQQPQQQAMASTVPATAAVVNGYAAPACASLDPADLLDLDGDLRLPSFDKWGNAQGPASNTLLPELDPDRADLGFPGDLLDNNPEEASLMDLLLN